MKKLLSLFLFGAVTLNIGNIMLLNNNMQYKKVDAATSYKTFYLYVPNTVTRLDGSEGLIWDLDDDNVKICNPLNTLIAGTKMHKIDTHLYAYTVDASAGQLQYTSVNSNEELVFAFGDSDVPSFSTLKSQGYNYLELIYHRRSDHNASGNWGSYTVGTAEKFAKTFNAVIGEGTCSLNGDTDSSKLSAVWNEMKTLYNSMPEGAEKSLLSSSLLSSENEYLRDFAKLYDYISSKPEYNYENFINRTPESWSMNKSININNNYQVNMPVIVIAVSSISLFSLAIYFFYKRKEK